MFWRKKVNSEEERDPRDSITIYPDGSISVDPEEIMRQYREQLRYSGQSDLSELDGEGLQERPRE